VAHKWTIAVAVAGVVMVGATALPATGSDVTQSGNLVFTGKAKKRDQKIVDVAPKGISLGDRSLVSETLKQGGATAGRLEADCAVIDASYEGQVCQITLLLKDGQITAQGGGLNKPLAGVGPTSTGAGDESAITGGTRSYQGASGSVTVKSGRSGDTVTVVLAG
jgi:hypothetical protein